MTTSAGLLLAHDHSRLARRGAPLQDVVDPLVQMESDAIGRGWGGTQRGAQRAISLAVPALIPGGHLMTLGQAALAAPSVIGSGPRGASIMFGKTRAQQELQRLLQDPDFARAAAASAGGAGAGINPE